MELAEVNRLVEDHIDACKRVVGKLMRRLPHHLLREDVEAEAMMGLVEAARQFDRSRGVEFKAYAEFRIRGAVTDYLRTLDPLSRTYRDKLKKGEEIPEELKNLKIMGGEGGEQAFLRIADQTLASPEKLAALGQTHARLTQAVSELPERLALVVDLLLQGFTLKEAGYVLGVTESRCCQMHREAVEMLSESLDHHLDN